MSATTIDLSSPLVGLDPETVRRTVLPNGLTVLVRRDASAPVVAVVTHVKAGYFDETDDVVGIAHVLEHMYFKGTTRRGVGDIAKQTKASGGYLNAHTIYDHTSYYTVLPSSGFVAGLDIQADAYANSLIDAEELSKELEVIIQEAKRKSDNPPAIATETLYELLHDRHRMRRWRIGREPGLRALTRDHVVGFYRNFYRPSNTILVVVGDVDADDALGRVELLYGSLADAAPARVPGPAEPADRHGFRFRELAGDIAQTQLFMGWRTPPAMHADTPLLDLVSLVLGGGRASRLYQAVRERKLASSISSYNYTPTELGVLVVHAECTPAAVADAAAAVWGQLRDVRDCGIGRHELERARHLSEARWVRRLETMEGQASFLAEWEALGDWTLGDRYLERVLTATPEMVVDAGRRRLAPEQVGLVIYRPEGAPPVAADAAAMRALLDARRPPPLPSTPPRHATPAPIRTPAPILQRDEAGVRVYRTGSGVPILVRRRRGAPIAHAGLYALGGAVDEGQERSGLTMLLARTALKGTERRTAAQIAEDAEMLGGSLGVALTTGESFGWSLSVPTRHLPAALDLLADVAQHATIPNEALETERAVALSDLAMLRDDMYRYPVRLATEAAFAGHAYGVGSLGTEESLRGIDAGQVRAWHRARVLEAPVAIAIVGDVDADEAAAVAARCFPRLRMAEPTERAAPSWPARTTQRAESRDKAQTALAVVFPGPARGDDDRYVAQLLAGVASGLGGRFFDELRDRRSLAYTVHAFASERLLAGMFVAYIATSPEREDVARRGLLAEFDKLRDVPVSDEEIDRAKTYAVGTHAIRQQSGGSVLADLIDAWLLGRGLAELEEHDERVRRVTPAAIQALARRYFDESRRVEGVVRGVGRTV